MRCQLAAGSGSQHPRGQRSASTCRPTVPGHRALRRRLTWAAPAPPRARANALTATAAQSGTYTSKRSLKTQINRHKSNHQALVKTGPPAECWEQKVLPPDGSAASTACLEAAGFQRLPCSRPRPGTASKGRQRSRSPLGSSWLVIKFSISAVIFVRQ